MDHNPKQLVIRSARCRRSDRFHVKVADQVQDRFDEGVAFAREQLGKLGNPLPKDGLFKAQWSLANLLEREPLLVGAISLVIGAAIAGAFRVSDLENEYVGKLSDGLKDDLGKRGTAVSQALREASDTVMAEAGDAGAEAADRVKRAAADAGGAFKEKVKPA
ncbi:hypothetical protein [Bradyrhizobium sp.]|uniref:hypothetical protein n=1 Tax=Bradyrhizobium sp. TaxID=376 RepID=UPI0025BE8DAB|nr:hypothetical protein [Bradyrhizobium sp.]